MSFKIMGRRTNPKGITGEWGLMEVNHITEYDTMKEATQIALEVLEFKKPGLIFDEKLEFKVV